MYSLVLYEQIYNNKNWENYIYNMYIYNSTYNKYILKYNGMKIFYFTQAYKQENETSQTGYSHWKVDQQISDSENFCFYWIPPIR